MIKFSRLLDQLSYTPSRNGKLSLMADYFKTTPDPDRGLALGALTDAISFAINARQTIGLLATRHISAEMFKISRDYVGDSAETLALIWPSPSHVADLRLSEVYQAMLKVPRAAAADLIAAWLDQLDATGRWALLKFISGALRTGVSARLAKLALAQAFDKDVEDIEQAWHGLEIPYAPLFDWLTGKAPLPTSENMPLYRPLMLSHPLEDKDFTALDIAEYQIEWKWDGIRVQVAGRPGGFKLYSRSGDDITGAFPDIINLDFDATLDGELLVGANSIVAPFQDLQQRLNRKTVSKKSLTQFPAFIRLYDILDVKGRDVRSLPLSERRVILEDWYRETRPAWADLSPLITPSSREDLKEQWLATREEGIEGMMLKRRDSPYVAGRPKGLWWKWKRSAITADCVLLYAQRGSGKRSSYYSDYTFAAWDESKAPRELVPVGKAYSGFTNEELLKLDHFVRHNTTQTFGPVRQLKPQLVLEVAFDAVQKSGRHKSGIAMRFPRISRIRWDKPAEEADTVQYLSSLI